MLNERAICETGSATVPPLDKRLESRKEQLQGELNKIESLQRLLKENHEFGYFIDLITSMRHIF